MLNQGASKEEEATLDEEEVASGRKKKPRGRNEMHQRRKNN